MSDENQVTDGQTDSTGNANAQAAAEAAAAEINDSAEKTGQLPPQNELNAILAKHKRGLQDELNQTKKTASEKERAFLELKKKVEQFTEGQPVEEFMQGVEQTLQKLDSDAEKQSKEAKKVARALEEAQKRAQTYEQRFNRAMIDQAINSAAGPKVVSPAAARLIGKELADKAKVLEDGNVVFTMDVTDEDGDTETKDVSAQEAVEALERDVTNFGTLFKSTVNSGAGSEVDGLKRGKDGTVDIGKLSYSEHIKLKRENPELFEELVRGS